VNTILFIVKTENYAGKLKKQLKWSKFLTELTQKLTSSFTKHKEQKIN